MRLREVLRNKRKTAKVERIDIDKLQRYIEAYQCPYCKDGTTYKMLPLHIYQIHGTTAYDLRAEYGMTRSHKLSSMETRELQSSITKQRLTLNPNDPFMLFDRHLTILHRYEDGGKRPEAIEKDRVNANKPNVKRAFIEAMRKVDRKAAAAKISPELRAAICSKGGQVRQNKYSKKEREEIMAKLRSLRTKESEAIRIKHATETMNTKYRNNPEWREKFHLATLIGNRKHAKITIGQRSQIIKLFSHGISMKLLAARFGVSRSLISLITKEVRAELGRMRHRLLL